MKLKLTVFLSLFVALNIFLNPSSSAAGVKATPKQNANKVPVKFSPVSPPPPSEMITGQSPGATPFTRIPFGPSCFASDFT